MLNQLIVSEFKIHPDVDKAKYTFFSLNKELQRIMTSVEHFIGGHF